jgi:flagellar L-ring protein precursor FlgH
MLAPYASGQSGSLFNPTPEKATSEKAEPLAMPPKFADANILPPVVGPGQVTLPSSDMMMGNTLQAASWTLPPPTPPRTLKIHDIVSIRVDELATSTAQGNVQSRKNGLYDAKLSDWLDWVSLDTIKPAPQTGGDPRVQGSVNETFRAQSNLQTREQMTLNVAAEIADIRPNGTIVLSARKTISDNDNIWKVSLSGICRAQDIGPDNVVLSRNIFELKIDKAEEGHVRDGYSRGWFTKWLARFKPF